MKDESTPSNVLVETSAPSNAAGVDHSPAPVPYDRFNEVVKERNRLRTDLETVTGQHKSASEQLAGLIGELAAAKADALRMAAAVRAGLPLELADRLQGKTAEEIATDAGRLAAFIKPVSPGVPPAGGGSPVLPLDVSRMTPAQIREHQAVLLRGKS